MGRDVKSGARRGVNKSGARMAGTPRAGRSRAASSTDASTIDGHGTGAQAGDARTKDAHTKDAHKTTNTGNLNAEAKSRAARKRATRAASLKTVGWREWVAFPDFGGPSVRAKVDTGARTSAIHARNVKISIKDGQEFADFDIYPHQRDAQTVLHCRAPIIARRRIRNSGGQIQDRVIVRTTIAIGEDRFEIDLSLTRRDRMGYRMLLGRRALKNRYVVDAGRSYVQGPSKTGRKRRPDLRKTIEAPHAARPKDDQDATLSKPHSAVRRDK